ncbi:unnamed protein product, partial [Mesorhabditis spiculigera]
MPAEPSISDSRHSSVAKSHSDSDTWLLLAGRPDAEIELTLTFGDDEKAVENCFEEGQESCTSRRVISSHLQCGLFLSSCESLSDEERKTLAGGDAARHRASSRWGDATGRTALMHAITMNDPDIIAHLLQKGADVNHQDENGDTPLLLSKQARPAISYIMGALLDAGADPAVKNSKGICLADNPDQTTRDVIAGQRIAPELKPFGQAHNPLFGRSVGGGGADGGSGSESGEDIPIQIDESPRSSRPSTAGRRAGDPIPISAGSALDDDEDLGMSPEQGPSSSTTPGRSRKSRFESSNFAKDDISSLDYLTRLRLSKILDNNAKWQDLAMELECGHMTELIQICADENSSPTMIFLDQYEMVPGSKVSAMRTGFVALGLPECVKLLDERVTY